VRAVADLGDGFLRRAIRFSPVFAKQSDLDAALKRAQRRLVREQKKASGEAVGPEESDQPEIDVPMPEQQTPAEPVEDIGSKDQPEIDPDAMFRNMG